MSTQIASRSIRSRVQRGRPSASRPRKSAKSVAASKSQSSTQSIKRSTPTFKGIRLRLHTLTCVNKTKEPLDLKKDKIRIDAIKAVGEVKIINGKKKVVGVARKGSTVSAGKFKKRETKHFSSPKKLAEFSLGPKTSNYSKGFVVTLVATEIDKGGTPKIINKLIDAMDKEADKAIKKESDKVLADMAFSAASGNIVALGANVLKSVGLAVSKAAKNCFVESREDDVFKESVVQTCLNHYPTRAGVVNGGKKSVFFEGRGGKYKAVYDWIVV